MPHQNIKQKYNAKVPTPSPPIQLPTPLPEEEHISAMTQRFWYAYTGIGQSVRGGGQVSEARRAGKQMEQSKARSDW